MAGKMTSNRKRKEKEASNNNKHATSTAESWEGGRAQKEQKSTEPRELSRARASVFILSSRNTDTSPVTVRDRRGDVTSGGDDLGPVSTAPSRQATLPSEANG